MIAWVVLSWIPTGPDHPLGKIADAIDRVVRPVIAPLRRVLPPLRLGGVLLDLSPLVLLIGLNILIGVLRRLP